MCVTAKCCSSKRSADRSVLQGAVQTIFSGLSFPGLSGEVTGDSVIEAIYPVISQGAGWNVMALFAFAVVFRLIAFLALKLSFRFGSK